MTKIYFARHGESEWNIIGRIQGQYNSKLTELGFKQAEKLANKLKNKNINHIYTSDLDRAYYTGKKLSDINGASVSKDKRLRELYFGNWQEKYRDELIEESKLEYKKWLNRPEDFQIPGGESLIDLRIRMNQIIKEILNRHKDESVLIVSHGVAIKMGILILLEAPDSMYKNLAMDNVGLSLIEVRDFNNVLRFHNDTSHLGDNRYDK